MSSPAQQQAVQSQLDATDIDLQCALAFGRSALRVLATLSQTARAEVDRRLGEEIDAAAFNELRNRTAIEAILEDTRVSLRAETGRSSSRLEPVGRRQDGSAPE